MPKIMLSEEHSNYIWVTPEETLKLKLIDYEVDCLKKAFNI